MRTMSIIGTIHEDVTTDILGKMGSWQLTVTLLSTTLVLPTVLNLYEDAFLLQPFHGIICVNNTHADNISLCVYTTNNGTQFKCDNWQTRFMWFIWLKRSWLIFCDDDSIKLLSTTVIYRTGLVFGFIVYGIISDSFGRRIAIAMNIVAELVLRLALTFCTSESWYRLLVFLKSLLASANQYLELVLVCEIASNSWRSTLCFITLCPLLLAKIFLKPIANFAPNYETFNFIAFLIGLIPLVILRWIPESPQWLLYNRKIHLAEKTLLIAAKKNGVKLCSDFKIRPVNHRVGTSSYVIEKCIYRPDNIQAYNCLDEEWTCVTILKTRNVRIVVLFSLFLWTLYYCLWSPLYLKVYKKSDKYASLQVLTATILMGSLNVCVGRTWKLRYLLMSNIMILGISSTLVIFMRQVRLNSIIIEIASAVGLSSGLISYALLLNITPRLLALRVRTTILGCCYSAGQLGTITCYLVSSLQLQDITAMVFTLVITFVLIAISFVLPDVDGRELPDTIKDMDYFSELSKPLRWATQKTHSPSNEEMEIRVYSFSSGGNNDINCSEESVPPQPVGFLRLWYNVLKFCRPKKEIS